MATHERSILGYLTNLSANVYPDSYANHATNDVFPHNVLVFPNSGTTDHAYGLYPIPDDYVGSAAIIVEWTGATNTGVARFGFAYGAVGGDDAESMDPAAATETVEQNDDAPSTAHYKLRLSISLTSGNFSANDLVPFDFYRESGDAADNYGDEVLILDVKFQYADA